MPPKKNPTTGSAVKSKSSAMRQIDDLIGQSEVKDGQKYSQLSMALQKEKLAEFEDKYGKASNLIMIQRNKKALTDARVLTTIFIGIAAGILGFDGPLGVIFYFGVDVVVSLLILVRFGFQPAPYF